MHASFAHPPRPRASKLFFFIPYSTTSDQIRPRRADTFGEAAVEPVHVGDPGARHAKALREPESQSMSGLPEVEHVERLPAGIAGPDIGQLAAQDLVGAVGEQHGRDVEPSRACVHSVGGAAQLATMFDEDAAAFPKGALLLAAGDNVGASPANSGLLEDRPAIDVENAWGLDATSYGNHEFDYGLERLLQHQARAKFPFLGANIVDETTGTNPEWVQGTHVFKYDGIRIGVIGIELSSTPELVAAGATEGLQFLDEAETIKAESEKLRQQGVKVQVVLIHQGAANGANAIDGKAPVPWDGPIVGIADAIQDTTVDAIIAGHTHRIANFMVGDIAVAEGVNAGGSYSVLQMVVKGQDVEWTGAATRVAKDLGVASRPDVKAIVDDANAQTAVLRNQVIGTQVDDITRAPSRLLESEMGNMVADAMRLKYPGVDAAYTNSGGLRADLRCTPPSAGEQPCQITWGEMFSVLPFGNRTVIETLTGAQLQQAFLNGFAPACDPNFAGGTGRFPQISGLRVTYSCTGLTPVVTGMWKTPGGIGAPADADRSGRHGALRDQRLHVRGRRRLHGVRTRDRRPATGRRSPHGEHRLRHRQPVDQPGRGGPHRQTMT